MSPKYRESDRVNFSTLKYIGKSALKYRDAVDNGIEDKPSWSLGRVSHTAVLEPMAWMNRYIIKPETAVRELKNGKTQKIQLRRDERIPEWRSFQAKAASEEREIITQEEHDKAVEISRSVLLNPAAAELFRHRPKTEVAIFWERKGIKLKSLLDIAAPNRFLADLKTIRDLTPEYVDSEIIRRDYLAQFAMYHDAWEFETGEDLPFLAVFAENARPFDSDVVELDEDHIWEGREIYEGWLDTLIECQRTGNWPGVGNGRPRKFIRPAWARTEAENDISDLGLEFGT